ncbi:MurR/RpiR family transcriptional regulator [Corynebacterium sp. MNWGS58]|uniref:MurR/RpiR family transcriptional regulator n=1 Tax=Corynebacterium sp. 102791.4 TaxID=3104612 RepID=UPI0035134D68
MSSKPEQWIRSLIADRKPSRAISSVLSYLSKQPHDAAFSTVQEIAIATKVNPATVVRTAQFLGYEGWTSFSIDYRAVFLEDLSAGQIIGRTSTNPPLHGLDSILEDARKLQELAETIDIKTIERLTSSITSSQKTIILSTGTFSGVGQQFVHNAQLLGIHCTGHFGAPSEQINAINAVTSADTVIIISLWKYSKVLDSFGEFAREKTQNVFKIGNSQSHQKYPGLETIPLPVDSGRIFPSTIAAVAFLQAVLSEIVHVQGKSAHDSLEQMEHLWKRFNIT